MPYDKNGKKKKVRRLVDVDVSHVSLVDRPANQTPFKFIKREATGEDTPMNITLKNMFGSRAPEVTSVIADTQAKATAVAKMLMTGDGELTEQDGLFVVRKSGTEPKDTDQIVHLGKKAGVAYGISNLSKALALYDTPAENFDEAVRQDGFVPGMYVGMEALESTIRNIAMSEETKSPEDFQKEVQKAIKSFTKYMDDLIGNLPQKAFKFEKALTAVTPGGPVTFTPEGFNSEVYDAVFGDEAPKPEAQMTDADAETAEKAPEAEAAPAEGTPAPAEAEAAETPAPDAEAAPAKEAAPENLEELPDGTPQAERPTQEELMASTIDALTKTVGEQIAAAMGPLTERLNAQDAAVGKLTKAVGGSVSSTPEEDNVVHMSKAQDDAPSWGADGPPLMDTAYKVTKQG